MTSPPPEPHTTVVEFGPAPADEPRPATWFWHDPRLAWVPAALGAAALFGSLVGEWQIVDEPDEVTSQLLSESGVQALNGFGAGWVLGGMLLASCAGLALLGQPVLRPFARTAGLVLDPILAGLLIATTLQLDQPVAYRNAGFVASDIEWEITLGRGLYLAYAALGLLALALWLARRPARPPQPPPAPAAGPEPGQVTVGPADPIRHATDDHEWR